MYMYEIVAINVLMVSMSNITRRNNYITYTLEGLFLVIATDTLLATINNHTPTSSNNAF